MPEAETIICALLRGERPTWPADGNDAFTSLFLERSAYHGVQALLHQHLTNGTFRELGWPPSILDACREAAVGQAMWEMRHKEILGSLLDRLAEIGVRPILFKGTALAYSAYPAPFMRRRGDTDALIPLHAKEQSCEALESLGFRRTACARGDLVSNAIEYAIEDAGLGAHEIDLHWRISNAQVLSRLFSYDELVRAASPLPALSPHAIGPGDMHALAIACMHRAEHKECPYFVDGVEYYDGDRLIWFYDMSLICKNWESADYDAFFDLVEEKRLLNNCLEALEKARAYFGSGPSRAIVERRRKTGANDVISTYLAASPLDQYSANFAAIPGAGDKLRFLIQILFPPVEYMREMYAHVEPNWLAWLYVHRIVNTVAKRLKRTFPALFQFGDADRS
ncbi:MAG: hypothetical protein EKK29_16390 [Hyphomicrobiales bacterium]|nr:MAG: hypothetical protein EKK29_16390 [Hyphomicrobiales bacterium]